MGDDATRREQLLQELIAKMGEYREASRRVGGASGRPSAASAMDLNRLHLETLMRLHREIGDLTRAIVDLARPEGRDHDSRRARLAEQLQEAERALQALPRGENDPKYAALALEVRHLSLLLELT